MASGRDTDNISEMCVFTKICLLAYYGVVLKCRKNQLFKNPEKVILDWSLSFSKMDKYYLSKTRKNILKPKLSFIEV